MRGFPTTALHMLPKDPLLTTNVICVGRWERGNSVRLLEGWRRHVLQTPTPINSFVSCTILLFWLMISDAIAFLPLEAHKLLLVKNSWGCPSLIPLPCSFLWLVTVTTSKKHFSVTLTDCYNYHHSKLAKEPLPLTVPKRRFKDSLHKM